MSSSEGFNGPASSPPAQHSPWHSPVPYLFGGLAAMLGLIAFALLILACSYWKLSGYLDSEGGEGDIEAGDANSGDKPKPPPVVFEEKFLVIMAGQAKPTFLATPISTRTSSFGSNNNNSTCECSHKTSTSTSTSEEGEEDKTKQGNNGDQVLQRTMEPHESSLQIP